MSVHYLIGKTYSQNEQDKANQLAYESELLLANEIGKFKGYHELLHTRASELFKPITSTTIDTASLKMKQNTDEQIRQEIQNDPSLSNIDKLQLLGKLDKVKLEHHTPKNEPRLSPEEQRRKELTDAFRIQNDFVFGLIPVDGVPGEYMFGILQILANLGLFGWDRDYLFEHHRIIFDLESGKIRVGTMIHTEDPVQFEYAYSKDLLWLLTQNTIEGTEAAKRSYQDIVDKCLNRELSPLKYSTDHRSYDEFLVRVKGNKKFEKWISVKYKIPLRVQPKRGETSGRTRYTDTSVYKTPGDEEDEEGEGMHRAASEKTIILSPHTNDRIKRAFVLLGNKKSSKENNPDTLAEFTSILDSLLSEGSLSIDKYKLLMKKFIVNS